MLIVKYILLLALLAIGVFFYFKKGKPLIIKALCSTLVFAYAISGALGGAGNPAFRFLLVGGLLCCLIGDIAINFSLIAGMAVFAAAHICFIAGFITAGFLAPPAAPLTAFAILCGLTLFTIFKLKMAAKEILPAACVYSVLITFMVSLAVCSPARYGGAAFTLSLASGSVLFMASDILLAIVTSAKGGNKLDYISLSTYYLATSLFAFSLNII